MIRGKRIKLRRFEEKDIPFYLKHIQDINSIGEFWPKNLITEKDIRKEFNETGFWSEKSGKLFIENEDGEIIGNMNLFKGIPYVEGYEIGYRIYEDKNRGKGYMTEALSLFASYLFAVKPIKRLQVNAVENNIASCKVALKSGFSYEGTIRNAYYSDGEYHNIKMHSLLASECPSFKDLSYSTK